MANQPASMHTPLRRARVAPLANPPDPPSLPEPPTPYGPSIPPNRLPKPPE